MKAQEYVDKYFAELPKTATEMEEAAKEMFREISREINTLREKRNVKTDSGAVSIVREIDEKWNSISSKIEKKYGVQIIKRNVIWNFYLADEFPDFERKGD